MSTTERRESISAVDFLSVFVPMARKGCSATEIGDELGRDAAYVTNRASQLRAVDSRVPKLQAKTRSSEQKIKDLLSDLLGDSDDVADEATSTESV